MQFHTPRRSTRRRGTTLVEVAIVLNVFLLFMFGIFEYCRYIFILQISTNAARDAARYAVVSAGNSSAQPFTVHTGPALAFEAAFDPNRPMFNVPFLETYLKDRTAGTNNAIASFQVRVFPADTNLLFSDPVVIKPKLQSAATGTWNNAAFTERIGIQIVGYYNPILPTFLMMGNPIPVNTVCLMGSEG